MPHPNLIADVPIDLHIQRLLAFADDFGDHSIDVFAESLIDVGDEMLDKKVDA